MVNVMKDTRHSLNIDWSYNGLPCWFKTIPIQFILCCNGEIPLFKKIP